MHFYSTILISVFGATVLAAPANLKERQSASNPVTATSGIIAMLGGTVPAYTGAICENFPHITEKIMSNFLLARAVTSIRGTGTGGLSLVQAAEGNINFNLGSIASALTGACGSLGSATSGLASGAGGSALGLGQADVTQLTNAVTSATALLSTIRSNILSIQSLVPGKLYTIQLGLLSKSLLIVLKLLNLLFLGRYLLLDPLLIPLLHLLPP